MTVPGGIEIKTKDEIARMREASLIVYEILQKMRAAIAPGITLLEVDAIAEGEIERRGAVSAFKGYRGTYPNVLCISPNEVVVHGIPTRRKLVEGDIVSLDFGVVYKGWFGDSAISVPVGKISDAAQRLLDVTRESLDRGIAKVLPGNRVSDIGAAVEEYVVPRGFSVVRDYVGHGIGKKMHEEPQVPNYGPGGRGPRLKPGIVLAVEPMVNEGTADVDVLDDGWTVVTADGKLSAHFEHTIACTEDGPLVLTRP